MKRCKTCKFWKRDTPDILFDGEEKISPLGDCDCEKFVFIGRGVETPVDGVGYSDYEGYYDVSIEFGEDFGCIHYEKVEK